MTNQRIGAGKAVNRLSAEAGEMVNNLLVYAKNIVRKLLLGVGKRTIYVM